MTQRIPTVRQVSWLAAIPQLLVLMLAMGIGWFAVQSEFGLWMGCGAYLLCAVSLRRVVARDHCLGVALSKAQRFTDAIPALERSYDFFSRHVWIDRYRAFTLLSASAISYREMALLNIAFACSQSGQGQLARQYYQRTLEEFPDSIMATAALRMITSAEQSPSIS